MLLDHVLEPGRRITKLPHHRELNGGHAEILIPGIGLFKKKGKNRKEGKRRFTQYEGNIARLSV